MRALPPWESALDAVADRCAELLAQRDFPDLSDVIVLVPGLHAAAPLRARVHARAGIAAMVAPACHTIASLAGTLDTTRRVREQRARLSLLAALKRHPRLTGDGDPWTLVEAVLALFRELDDAQVALDPDTDALAARLRRSYGDGAPEQPLRREAALVATLWRAWREHADGDADWTGDAAVAAQALADWRRAGGAHVVVAALERVPAALAAVLARGQTDGWVTWFARRADGAAPDAVHALAACALADDAPDYRSRGAALRVAHATAPPADAWSVVAADDTEHEARVVDLQIRRWWLDGHRRIALVTEDRKLARRLRALLARAGIPLMDGVGWALSTTSAAAAVERWLEAVEEDFRAGPLVDVLKSPFTDFDAHDAWAFEEGIVRREGVGRGLDAYARALARRARRLPPDQGDAYRRRLDAMLERVSGAAAPLQRNLRGRAAPADMTAALRESLARAGFRERLAADAAGQRVLEEIEAMARAATDGEPMDWREWRAWLARTLENATFRPGGGDGVQLMALAASAEGEFDAMVVAGADDELLPGRPVPRPFFNDAVRAELGLETAAESRARRAIQFRCALALAPRRLVSWARERADGERLPSAWLAAMATVAGHAWGGWHDARDLAALARDDRTLVIHRDGAPAPTVSRRPVTVVDRVPARWSATAHQEFVDCPYRWFASRRLGLRAPDRISDAMSKQEFGQLVHRCLQAFHTDLPELPGPFGRVVTRPDLDDAEALLVEIGDAVFAREAPDDFVARTWLAAWRRAVPALARFELERAEAGWRVIGGERVFERELPGVVLHGRIDRLERRDDGAHAVIDYKTGASASRGQLSDGESVQLASYALGVDHVAEIAFVALDGKATGLPGGRGSYREVDELLEAVGQRLADAVAALRAGAPVVAHGDRTVCRWCAYDGLCRTGTWEDA